MWTRSVRPLRLRYLVLYVSMLADEAEGLHLCTLRPEMYPPVCWYLPNLDSSPPDLEAVVNLQEDYNGERLFAL